MCALVVEEITVIVRSYGGWFVVDGTVQLVRVPSSVWHVQKYHLHGDPQPQAEAASASNISSMEPSLRMRL